MASIKIKLIPALSFRVESESGKHLGDFVQRGKWNGFVELDGERGKIICEEPETEVFTLMPERIPKPQFVSVLRASPDLILEMAPPTTVPEEPR